MANGRLLYPPFTTNNRFLLYSSEHVIYCVLICIITNWIKILRVSVIYKVLYLPSSVIWAANINIWRSMIVAIKVLKISANGALLGRNVSRYFHFEARFVKFLQSRPMVLKCFLLAKAGAFSEGPNRTKFEWELFVFTKWQFIYPRCIHKSGT